MSDMPSFALIGAAGYVAPRHLKAMKETGGRLLAAYDPNDSVGVLDSYFPDTDFFTEFERFDRHLDKLKRTGNTPNFVSICSPNYLHDAHIRFGLRLGSDVICEKPLVLNPWNIDALLESERETGRKVNTILQLRLHPAIRELRERVSRSNDHFDLDLTYITSRGNWYFSSWKGDLQKSGGIATNIGIHFFDMLIWVFGKVNNSTVHLHTHDRAAGLLELEKARVRWFLSINPDTLPAAAVNAGHRTYRSITMGGESIEFSEGFTDLHTRSYEQILSGRGFGLNDALPAVDLSWRIRNAVPAGLLGDYHPLANLPLSKHPFERSV